MSELKTFEQLTEDYFKKNGISDLSDRPNQASTFGTGGLTAAELKARFDKLPQLIREKLNEIYTALSGENATQYIAMPTGTQENPLPSSWGKYQNVSDFILAFASGEISEDLVVISNEGSFSLKKAINNLFKATNSNKEDISELHHQVNSIYEVIRLKQDKLIAGEGIVISGNVISAPGQSDVAGTIVLIDNKFAKEISFTSNPQEQLDGKADKTQLDEKADKDNVDAVTRIDVSALPTDSSPLSAMITAEIQQAVARKPIGASRANIEFYNVPATDETGSYEYWNDVDFFSNCNYFFSDMDDVSLAKYFNLENLKNCNFEGFNIGSTEDLGLVFSNCENIQILNSTIKSLSARPLRFENCNELYFENCVFERSSYPFDYEITFTDNGSGFRWIMFDNCIFSKHEGMTSFDASGVTNTKSLISFSNCHFDDLTNVSEVDVIKGLGKVSISATEDQIPVVPTNVGAFENDVGYALKSEIATVYRVCGSVENYADLNNVNLRQLGDVYNVINAHNAYPAGTNFVWNGTEWDALGGTVSLYNYVKKTDLATATKDGVMSATDKAKLDSVENGANKYVLPTATGARLGGVIVGENLAVDGNGILRANYPVATPTQAGLMGDNDKFVLSWLYANCGKSYHAYGECGWVGSGTEPNEINAAITYVRTGYGKGLISLSYILTAENISTDKWHVSIDKVNDLLAQYGIKIKKGEAGNYTKGGSWVRQGEPIQTTPHTKARTCVVTPYCFLPAYYHRNTEGGISLGTIGTSSFQANEVIQMWNIPVEEE